MKPVAVKSEQGRLMLIAWLEKNDPEWLQVMKDTSAVFGPLGENATYLNHDNDKQKQLWAWMRAEQKRISDA